jgi:predicted component of type VI protein secretion system
MGRHSAPEGRHRRPGALLAQAGLVVVLGLVAVSVLVGSSIVRDRMVNGTFTGAQTAAEPSPGVATLETSPEPSPASSAPARTEAAPGVAVTPGAAGPVSPLPSDSHEQVKPTEENLGGSRAPGTTAATGSDEPAPTAGSSDQASVPDSRGTSEAPAPTSTASATPRAAAPDITSPTAPAESFANCAEAKAAGISMIPDADPRYDPKLDHDGDGFACDAHGDPPTSATTTAPAVCPAPTRHRRG